MSSYSLYSYNKQQFNNDVSFNNNTTLATTTISGVSTHSGRAVFTTDVSLNGPTTITGVSTHSGRAVFTTDVSLNGPTTISGVSTHSGRAVFTTDVSLNGPTTITGVSTHSGRAVFTTDVSLNGPTTITGVSTHSGRAIFTDVSVNGLTTMTGSATISGNVGIGTTAPARPLVIHNSTSWPATFGSTSSGPCFMDFINLNAAGRLVVGLAGDQVTGVENTDCGIIGTWTNKSLLFATNTAERMRISAAGYVGIGTTNPGYKLDVNGGIGCVNLTRCYELGQFQSNDNYLDVGTEIGTGNGHFVYGYGNKKLTFGTSGTPRMTILSGGNVGIGTTNPSYPLHVDKVKSTNGDTIGTAYYFAYSSSGIQVTSANGFDISIRCNTVWGFQFVANSDTRIKTNIVDIDDGNALSILRQIKPKTYDYVDKIQRGDGSVIGFIAQEIKEIIPKAVSIQKEYIPSFYTRCQVYSTDASNIVLVTSPIDLSWNALHDQSGNAFVDADNNYCSDASGNKQFKIKLYDQSNNEITCKTTNVLDKRSFLVDIANTKLSVGEYFLYGQEVDDFHTLDKNAIFTVVTAAVQDIDRKQVLDEAKIAASEAQIQAHEVKISELQVKNAALEAKNAALEARLAALEQAVAAL